MAEAHKNIVIKGEGLSVQDVWTLATTKSTMTLSPEAREKMLESKKYIQGKIEKGETMYGVNTGFGAFSSVKISQEDIVQLQKNLIRSHSVGVGEPLSIEQTKAILCLRANALARGHSGIRVEVVEKILEFYNNEIIPWVPAQGSVGASGDLAPLSHVALSLIGEGYVWSDGKKTPTADILKKKNVQALELQAKEGLSLINGCQVMTAIGLLAAYEARRLLLHMDLAGAMSLEALRGSRSAFDPLISATRPHPGEAKTARNMLKLLGSTSKIAESHADCNKVQDAYSLRCIPAVHGATKDTLRYVLSVLETEANSSTDNPLVFSKDNKVLSCGNFHGEPVAFALDFLAISISASASMSECRIEKLINPAMSDLPAFLAPHGGLNSGHMIVQVAAAALVSENKILSHPASVDSIPTSADKEDHVSMGTIAARKLKQVLNNAENIVSMELLSSSQALDLLKPLTPSAAVQGAYDIIRKKVPYAEHDRVFSEDIQSIRQMIKDDLFSEMMKKTVGDLEC